jgi:hypothetical protein
MSFELIGESKAYLVHDIKQLQLLLVEFGH